VGIGPVELLVITALCVAVLFVFTVPVGKWSVAVIRKAVGDAIHRLDPGRRAAPKFSTSGMRGVRSGATSTNECAAT